MAHPIQITITDTSTEETRVLTGGGVSEVETFNLDYLDTLFDYEDYDDFDVENLVFSDPKGFPDFLDGTDPDDVELLFRLRGDVHNDEDWEKALSLVSDSGELREMCEAVESISRTLDPEYHSYYLDYVEHMNYVADASTFVDDYIGIFPDLATFAHQHLRSSGTSLESIDPDYVTVQDWIDHDFKFTFWWIDRPDGVLVFWIN